MQAQFEQVDFGGARYRDMLALREAILRRPLGLSLSEQDTAQDATDWHFAALLENKLAGCLLVRPVSAESAKLRQMAVVESARGKRSATGCWHLLKIWRGKKTSAALNCMRAARRWGFTKNPVTSARVSIFWSRRFRMW